MGEFVARNIYSRFKYINNKINKRKLLRLVGCLHCNSVISGGRLTVHMFGLDFVWIPRNVSSNFYLVHYKRLFSFLHSTEIQRQIEPSKR